MIRLSVVIITLNEERNIERCLQSVKTVADEIVVADSFSTDRTKEICYAHGVSFFEKEWMGYSAQKNFAHQQCSNNWVLSLDADEELSIELSDSIAEIKKGTVLPLCKFNRLTNYCGQWIRHGDWYPDRKLRMYDRRNSYWEGIVHEQLVFPPEEKIILLKGDCFHYSYYSINEHIKQMEKFTTLMAGQAFEKGKRSPAFLILFAPLYKFCKSYFFRLGFLDGYFGYLISRISAQATFLKYIKLRELYSNRKKTS